MADPRFGDEPQGGPCRVFIATAIRTVARARGLEELAARLGVSRSGLCKALGSKGNPSFSTMLQLLEHVPPD
jgi:probable addiction module antidote protein